MSLLAISQLSIAPATFTGTVPGATGHEIAVVLSPVTAWTEQEQVLKGVGSSPGAWLYVVNVQDTSSRAGFAATARPGYQGLHQAGRHFLSWVGGQKNDRSLWSAQGQRACPVEIVPGTLRRDRQGSPVALDDSLAVLVEADNDRVLLQRASSGVGNMTPGQLKHCLAGPEPPSELAREPFHRGAPLGIVLCFELDHQSHPSRSCQTVFFEGEQVLCRELRAGFARRAPYSILAPAIRVPRACSGRTR